MSIFQIHVQTTTIMCVATFTFLSAGFCFGETGNTLTPENVNPEQIKIILDVWPKEILAGDCYYVTYFVQNQTNQPLNISPHDLFKSYLFSMDGGFHITKIHDIPGFPTTTFGGHSEIMGAFSSETVRNIELGNCTIPPHEKRVIHVDRYIAQVTEKYLAERKNHNTAHEIKITAIGDKYKNCVENIFLGIHVQFREPEEKQLVEKLLAYHTNRGDKVKTTSGTYNNNFFFMAKRIPAAATNTNENLPNLSAWREFEEKLSPGTLRDEIRLGRIQVQYLDGEKEAALNELRDWFAEMEPIQSMTLAAGLCLPEGVDPEDESQSLMFYGVMNQPEEEALECHKHYMAMRREIDKIVSPYNTLPRRKLRDTNAY